VSGLRVDPVRGRADREAFLDVPARLRGADPLWVPPVRSRARRAIDPRRGPFFEVGEAALFLARRDGRAVGRISAQVDRRHLARHDAETGFFGFFECADDPAAAAGLLGAARAWLARRGMRRLLGPLGFSIYDEVGVLVEGFEEPPALLLTHNPPYYGALLRAAGLRKAVDWYALLITTRDIDGARMKQRAAALAARAGLALRAPSAREVVRRAEEIRQLFNVAWEGNWGHVPFTRRQFAGVFRELRPLLRSDLIRIVEDGGRIVAFSVTVPDVNPVLRSLGGRLTPAGLWRLVRAARWAPLRRVKTVLLGVEPAYRNRRLHDAMILDTYARLIETEPLLEAGDCSLICETLGVFIRHLARYGARPYKTYRLFQGTV
jgi:hypothetical protein